MKHNICSVDWHQFFSSLPTNIYMETFLNKLAEICSSSAPLLKKNCKRISSFHKERKTLMKKRTKFRKQCKVSPNTLLNSKLMKIEQDILKSHSNIIIHNESTAVAKIKEDPYYFYRYAMKFSIVKSGIGPLLDSSGNLTSDKKFVCKLLLDQFNKIVSTPNAENRVNDPVSYFTCEMGSLTPQLSNITIDKNKIIEAIHDLSTHSAPGPDCVPAIVFKECAEALSEPLMILFNSFFDCHYIPDILKKAAIVPVYKSGERSNPINYPPISLTPILMKILERIVRKQVVQFLTDNTFVIS